MSCWTRRDFISALGMAGMGAPLQLSHAKNPGRTLVIHGAEHHGIYFTDLAHRTTKLAVERRRSDYLVSLTSDSPIAVHVCIGLPGYGYTWLTADNAGKGYREGSRELWPELLDSQLVRCRAFAEREGCSLDLDTVLELARQEKYAEALTVAVLSGEAMAVAHAKHKLARRAANSEPPLISSTVFDCGPSWRTLDPIRKPQILRPDEQWKMVAATANATVLPCFWGWVEHERGHYRWDPLDRVAAFADQHGMALKSFAVFWGGSIPPWFKALSFKEQLNAIEQWATALVSRYRGQVDIWEIVNEMHDWKFANPMGWSQDQLLTVTRMVSDLVAALDPGNPRVVNHCLVWGHYVQSTERQCWSPLTFLDDVLAADIPFEGVGLQWIFKSGRKDVRSLLDCALHLERFIALGKDIYLTEMGVSSSSRPRDKADVLDGWRGPWSPEGQADWLENWYTIAASYPQVKFMNWWDFADGNEFIPNGGLVDRDGRAKPAYRRHQAFYRSLAAGCATATGSKGSLPLTKVEVSMHMVLPVESEGKYYITGTTDLTNVWEGKTKGFYVYSSKDLKSWDKQLAWAPPAGSEWNSKAWGAIILPLKDKYILVGAVYSSKRKAHGILTMEADQPEGPYTLRSDEPLMKGIDPHVVTDKDGSRWLVVGGLKGIMAAPLAKDLRSILAEPKTILLASKVPGTKPSPKLLAKGKVRRVQDAPVFHRLPNGELVMLFSTNYEYPDGVAFATIKLRSKSGELSGPWKSEGVFLPKQHGASFWRRFDGELMLTVKPFGVSIEEGHPEFIRLKETRDDVFLHPDGSSETPSNK